MIPMLPQTRVQATFWLIGAVTGFICGMMFCYANEYYRCRQDAFQLYCDRHFFGSKSQIEFLNLNK